MKTITRTLAASLVIFGALAVNAQATNLPPQTTNRGFISQSEATGTDRFQRRLRLGTHQTPTHSRRTNDPSAFGFRNLSGNFEPRFNVTGRRVRSLLRY